MMVRLIKFFGSMQFMLFLILLFASVIGYATFIENDFGRASAKALVFNTWWFELILFLLVLNLLNNLVRFKLFRWKKLPVLTFHLSFILILVGSVITRYVSYEGMMHIREGQSTNLFISDDTFLKIHIHDNEHQVKHDEKLFLSAITNNNFSFKLNFKNHDIRILYNDFLPNVRDSLFTNQGDYLLHIVVPGENGMQSEYLLNNEQRIIKGEIFTFNNPVKGGVNFKVNKNNIIVCNSPYVVETMRMDNREKGLFNPLVDFTFKKRTLHSANGLDFVLKDFHKNARLQMVSSSDVIKDESENMLSVILDANGVKDTVNLIGGKGREGNSESFILSGLYFTLSYGSIYYTTPFNIYLRDFQLERYPGSSSPSSYAAEVTVLDNGVDFPYRIYMNNVLQYKGFRFFQSSYDKDEKGTILSVNHDWWGTLVTYIGYTLLLLGFIFVLFTKNSRFTYLGKKLRKIVNRNIITVFFLMSPLLIFSNEVIDINHANKFQELVIQDNGGRLKPANTLCSEYLRKISGKTVFNNLTSTQVILGMTYNPIYWSNKQIIKVSSDKLRILLECNDLESRSVRLAFNDFFSSQGDYLLSYEVESAYAKPVADRSQYEKDIIRVDERVNICFLVFNGGIFRLFPLPLDDNNTWLTEKQVEQFSGQDSLFVANIFSMYFSSIKEGFLTDNWTLADSLVNYIHKFQNKYGVNVIPSKDKIHLEILYNKSNVFSRLFIYYFILGLFLVILDIIQIIRFNSLIQKLIKIIYWLIIFGCIIHTLGLAVRWIISDHAPWSNGYESMIYIAWATMLAGIFYTKRSMLPVAATAIVSSLLLMVAHLNWLDPEITNLVPVLNSYWLMIHVSIITSSYGFFALGSMLGLLSLWLIIFKNQDNHNKFKIVIDELQIINERTLELGLFLLTIGTFLGGVWANESWGRYWGWDPKETWALVSILIYAFVLHLRFIPSINKYLIFNITAMFSIWTIIMTYFGVNYYLSGLHSYAAGDPMPIPNFVYYLLALMLFTSILASIRFKKRYL